MANVLRWSSVIPGGLVVESVEEDEEVMVVSARSAAERRQCPRCGRSSGRVHSRYVRTIADLPCAGRKVDTSGNWPLSGFWACYPACV